MKQRPKRYLSDEEWKEGVITALNAGRTLTDILGWKRIRGQQRAVYDGERAVIQAETLKRLRADYPVFDKTVSKLIIKNRKAKQKRGGSHFRDMTHCKRGHPLSGDNLIVRVSHGKWNERVCRACRRLRGKFVPYLPPETAARAMQALKNGFSIGQITKAGTSSYILTHRHLMVLRADPVKNAEIVRLSSANAAINIAAGIRKGSSLKGLPVASWSNRRLSGEEIMRAVRQAIPAYLTGDPRQEIEATLILALYEGTLKIEHLRERVSQHVRDYNRMFPTKFARGAVNAPLSLDAAAYRDSPTPLVETITQGLWG